MANRKVSLMLRVRTADGKRPFVNPVIGLNGKVKSLWAVVHGKPEHHPEGQYFLRYSEGGKRIWEPVGNDVGAALTAKIRREQILKAKELGIAVAGEESVSAAPRVTLEDAVTDYIADVAARRSYKTSDAYKYDLGLFQQSCAKRHLDDIERKDVIAFMSFLRTGGFSDRTIFNRIQTLQTFFRANGKADLISANDWPKYTEKVVAAYSRDDLARLFEVAEAETRLVFQFFLYSGAREQEVQYACWSDIDWESKTFSVREKPDLGFRPKDHEERVVPLPDMLVEALAARRRVYQDRRLIFPNGQGNPENHFLRILKDLALKAGLNCGHCCNKKGLCCSEEPVCRHWELHKFRKTFATMHHESGVSARTLQAWLGHSDLETTLAYLKVADIRSERTREQVNNTFAMFA